MMLKTTRLLAVSFNFARSKTQSRRAEITSIERTLLSGPSQRDDAAGVLGP